MTKEQLKSVIRNVFKQNGNQTITGENSGEALMTIVDNVPSQDEVISGIKGEAKFTNSPTAWTSGDPDLFERYTVKLPGTYTNWGGIIVTAEELYSNEIYFDVYNGAISKYAKPASKLKTVENVGSPGEFYFTDPAGRIGVKINATGHLETAAFGFITQQMVAQIVANVTASTGRYLADYNHIIGYGQSLSVGETETVITTSQLNPNLLCFDGVVRTSPYDKSLTGNTYPTNRRIAFAPLVERLNDGVLAGLLRETPSSGTGEMFAKSYSETVFKNLDKKIVLSAPGQGNTSITELDKGTTYYQRVIDDVTAGYGLASAMGKSYRCLSVTWTQSENDYIANTTKADYKIFFKQLAADLNTDIKAITGQEEDVALVCYQCATAKNAGRDIPSIAIAMYECSVEEPLIYMAAPIYHLNYKDGFHLKAASSKLLGAYYGDVINRIVMKNEDWKPLHIKSKFLSGNTITLNYHLPDDGELVFDTPHGINLSNKGFTFSDASNIITNLQIGDDKKSIKITCSSSPAGKTLQYAVQWQAVTNTQLNLGNIRDNAGEKRKISIDGEDVKMHNYAIIQEITI